MPEPIDRPSIGGATCHATRIPQLTSAMTTGFAQAAVEREVEMCDHLQPQLLQRDQHRPESFFAPRPPRP